MSTVIALGSRRAEKEDFNWLARMVVGDRTTTLFFDNTTLNAALIASSVLPKPTSPHNSLSMGKLPERSLDISFHARI